MTQPICCEKLREALREVISLQTTDDRRDYVCWVGESTMERIKQALSEPCSPSEPGATDDEWTCHYVPSLKAWSIISGPKHLSVAVIDGKEHDGPDIKLVVDAHNAALRRRSDSQPPAPASELDGDLNLPWCLDTCNLKEIIVKDSKGNTVHYEDLGGIPDEWQSFRREEFIREAHAAAQAMAKWSNVSASRDREMNYEDVARLFHDTYERLAPSFGYETRKDTKQFDPSTPNGKLMIAVCAQVAAALK